MKPNDDRPLGEYVTPKVDDARLGRQWSAVSGRLGAPRRPFRWVALGVSLAGAAALALIAVHPWGHAPVAIAVVDAGGAQTIALPDGSHVTVATDAALSVEHADPDRVHLVLASGAIEADVTHREGRTFVVSAGGHDVIVVGTRFRVATDTATLTVEVERGLVRVEGPSGEHLLGAGQRWTTKLDAAPPPSAAPPALDDTADTSLPEAAAPAVHVASARDLLVRATDARAAGHDREAAASLDVLRKTYRTDPRAGPAAFELGRIRLDALGDPNGAVEAFTDAIALSPRAAYVEDAEARRVEAFEIAGKLGACEKARAAYLERYPAGLHVRTVSQRCVGR